MECGRSVCFDFDAPIQGRVNPDEARGGIHTTFLAPMEIPVKFGSGRFETLKDSRNITGIRYCHIVTGMVYFPTPTMPKYSFEECRVA